MERFFVNFILTAHLTAWFIATHKIQPRVTHKQRNENQPAGKNLQWVDLIHDRPSPTSSSPAGGTGAASPYNNNSLEKIIQQVDDEFGYNVFYVALKRGCFAVCDMLILFGASLDTTIRGGETMLHLACFELPLDRTYSEGSNFTEEGSKGMCATL